MNSPCEKSEIIEEIRADVKELLKFKNTAMGIIIAINAMVYFIGWIITTVLKQ